MTVVLYTTLGCHLCDQARDLLLTVNPEIDIHAVDIAEDARGRFVRRPGFRRASGEAG